MSLKPPALLLGFVLAAVYLIGLPTARAQEKPRLTDAEHAAAFRKGVVTRWKWKPDQGVSLTTTKYAIDYVQRYDKEKYYALAGELYGLVLFQTATHDILVFKTLNPSEFRWGRGKFFLVIDRSSGEIVARTAGARYNETYKFVEVDSAPPLEIQRVTSGTSGTGLWWRWYRVYDLNDGFDTMLEVEGYTDDHRCPDVQPRFIEPDKNPRLAMNDISKTPKSRRFRMRAQLKFAGCADIDALPEFVRECRFDDKSRTFECKNTFVTTVTLSFKDLEETDPKATAQNIRWVLENADELRKNGFRFPKGFLEKVSRHLPEDSQVQ